MRRRPGVILRYNTWPSIDPGGVLGRDRSSLIRAVSGALPATCLSLLGSFFLPSLAFSADIPCDRSASLELPSGRLHVSAIDLPGDSEAALDNSDLSRDFTHEAQPRIPDFSSRTRSLAILREIFGEPVTEDSLDVLVAPAQELPREPGGSTAVHDSAVEVSDRELPGAGSSNDDSSTDEGTALLPGISGEQSLRYRRQMYRTDI